jgi:hypothetical protein
MTDRKWQFWIGPGGLNWGDRSTGRAHTTVGLLWVLLALYGLYWLAARVL